MYLCSYDGCGTSFKKKWRLVEHMVKHTGKKPFSCTEADCHKSFGRKSHLQRHIKNHSPNKDYQCPEDGCQCRFASKEILNHHRKRVHMDKPFKCVWPDCGKAFKKHQWLKSHTSQHSGILPHVCDHKGCNKAFSAPCKLRAHRKTHQGYACDIPDCKVIVYKWTDLRKHKHKDHSKSIPCDKCDQTFSTKAKLRVHSKVHQADREVFECPYEDCSRSYTRVSYLQQHVSNYHEGARPFACPHDGCVKTFAHKRSLLKHQIVHEAGYCKPPSDPKRKRSLASRLSGFPDAATRNISWAVSEGKMVHIGLGGDDSEEKVSKKQEKIDNDVDDGQNLSIDESDDANLKRELTTSAAGGETEMNKASHRTLRDAGCTTESKKDSNGSCDKGVGMRVIENEEGSDITLTISNNGNIMDGRNMVDSCTIRGCQTDNTGVGSNKLSVVKGCLEKTTYQSTIQLKGGYIIGNGTMIGSEKLSIVLGGSLGRKNNTFMES